jgi:hypothetical protein
MKQAASRAFWCILLGLLFDPEDRGNTSSVSPHYVYPQYHKKQAQASKQTNLIVIKF